MRYLEAVFSETEGQKKEGKKPPKWIYIQELFDSVPDLQWPGVNGTL